MRFLLLTIVLFFCLAPLKAQQMPYRISFVEGYYENLKKLTGELDSSSFSLELQKIKQRLFAKGHLLANIDRLETEDSLIAEVYVGSVYYWYAMGVQNIPQEYLSKAGYREKDFIASEVSYRQFNRLVNRVLDQATNNGYPFASLELKDIEVNNNFVKGVLNFTPGPVIKYDTLTILSGSYVRPAFLEAYLNVRRGELFSYNSVSALETSLQNLPYVRLVEPIELKFANNLCNISFGLKKLKANRFDAIIGLLPNQGNDQGLRITGYADLHLENLFRAGKSLTFQWQQFQPLSQTLLLDYKHPNLLKSPIGVGLEANLIRQDSAFLNSNISIDAFYARRRLEIAVLSSFISSRQLSTPADTTRLPAVADYNMNMFGLDFRYDNIGNLLNPRSGIKFSASLKFGTRNIRQNPALQDLLYDSLDLKSGQLQFQVNSTLNRGLGRMFAFQANLQGGMVWNSDRLFINDLMRIGGVNSLRGFNELGLYVSAYGLLRTEMRLLISEASRLFLFYDQAITFNKVNDLQETPLGFGAGIYLRTVGGDLQLIYALGVSQQQSLSLDQSKIHLGYVATF